MLSGEAVNINFIVVFVPIEIRILDLPTPVEHVYHYTPDAIIIVHVHVNTCVK